MSKELKAFENLYEKEIQEILVLLDDSSSGARKTIGDLWMASAHFLGYQNPETGQVEKGKGRLVWPIKDEDLKKHSASYPHFFKKSEIYKVRVRQLIDRIVPEGHLPSFYNAFLVVEVLEEAAKSPALQEILENYQKPVILKDPALGEFNLNKNYSCFEGYTDWLGEEVSLMMDVDQEDETTWNKALEHVHTLTENQKEWDEKFRDFAADELTELANDWLEEEGEEITEEDFKKRIQLSELSLTFEGEYVAYYNDDDLFWGHVITIYGDFETGMKSANIEG